MGLRELRMERGLSQRSLAEKAGMSYVSIANYERGSKRIGGMSLDTAYRLCKALHVSNPRKLLDDDKD